MVPLMQDQRNKGRGGVFLFQVLVFRPSRVNHLQFLLITLSQARTSLRLKFQKIDFYFPSLPQHATKLKQSGLRHANFPKPRLMINSVNRYQNGPSGTEQLLCVHTAS